MAENKTVWHKVCNVEELEMDDVTGITVAGKIYAVYYLSSGYYATSGLCTHEQAKLFDGYVDGEIIECPKHNARFNIITGKAVKRPACIDLETYPAKVEEGKIWIGLVQDSE
ncbi:MAG: non-heme iron oxygenase ferredoxin subunit [Eubacteriales bacterium]